MESVDIVFQRQVTVTVKTKIGKPPTRLQRQAPASLQLDQVNNARTSSKPFVTATSLGAIPLLSPLIVSPPPLAAETEEFRFPTGGGENEKGCWDDKKGAYSYSGGWQHPAVAGYVEPSSLFNMFQSKCVLVHKVQ